MTHLSLGAIRLVFRLGALDVDAKLLVVTGFLPQKPITDLLQLRHLSEDFYAQLDTTSSSFLTLSLQAASASRSLEAPDLVARRQSSL